MSFEKPCFVFLSMPIYNEACCANRELHVARNFDLLHQNGALKYAHLMHFAGSVCKLRKFGRRPRRVCSRMSTSAIAVILLPGG